MGAIGDLRAGPGLWDHGRARPLPEPRRRVRRAMPRGARVRPGWTNQAPPLKPAGAASRDMLLRAWLVLLAVSVPVWVAGAAVGPHASDPDLAGARDMLYGLGLLMLALVVLMAVFTFLFYPLYRFIRAVLDAAIPDEEEDDDDEGDDAAGYAVEGGSAVGGVRVDDDGRIRIRVDIELRRDGARRLKELDYAEQACDEDYRESLERWR